MAHRRDFISETRRMTPQQISGKISESKKRLLEIDQEKLLGKLKNVSSRRYLKREIAQMMTIRDEKVSQALQKEPQDA
ncbi:MAG: 50S ribosomal protein L29 [Candidatus Berkelbacteria bacterium]|nr:MAG: 50S ribosomal protein L29 [Candidatus Berkelbacteria bacterium]QQG52100.1 MAG: 50S ribosomal protein L29 [Candidatus Berkelbacteria bacterium]